MTIKAISVIICTHNRAAFLPKVIEQLCDQDYPVNRFEVIIVDNCSSDDTSDVVKRLIPNCKLTLRLVQEPRPGVTFARNRGAEEANYPYLAYLDDDCSVGADWLSQLVSGFGLSDQVSVVAGRVILSLDHQPCPDWLGPKGKSWLAEFNFPGSEPCVLDNPTYVCEGNMAITKEAWRSVGGFLGMDQFGSPHGASQEIVYLLEQIKRQGGKVAFIPSAVAGHHTLLPTRRQLLLRAYAHGISTAILDHLLKRFSWGSAVFYFLLDIIALFVFFASSIFFSLVFDKAAAMDYLLRAAARLGKVLSNLRIDGNWERVRSWITSRQDAVERLSWKGQS
ncbi:hypothetical protein MASR2M66_00740 [Chloroflexota bacterium]